MSLLVGATAGRVATAAVIGVLHDGRQFAQLSLMYEFSAARLRLVAAGHSIVPLGAGALTNAAALASVDVVWLPVLEAANAYTQAEREAVAAYATAGGRVVWIGEWGFYNAADNSLLSAFGLAKLDGGFNDPLTAVQPGQAMVSGPDGSASVAGTGANYGLIAASPVVAPVFAAAGGGVLVGAMDAGTGWAGAGRVALVCDSHMFESAIETDDHEGLLLNLVAWVEHAPGYTPAGATSTTSAMPGVCGGCADVTVLFTQVSQTGRTTVVPLGSGRCGFAGISPEAVPSNFVGWAFEVQTTAGLAGNATAATAIHYDAAALSAAGISPSDTLKVWRYVDGASSPMNVTHDAATQMVTAQATAAAASMVLLFGAQTPGTDCNSNEIPDECELDTLADCNHNGVPDACDLDGGGSIDCNGNGEPDECDVDDTFHAQSPQLSPIGAGAPQTCSMGGVPPAAGAVTVRVSAVGDFSTSAEYVDVLLNGANIGRAFESGGSDCPAVPNVADLVVAAGDFNAAAAGGALTIELLPSAAVNAALCEPASYASVEITYARGSVSGDCNANGMPDECEPDEDCDGDGVRDLCAIAAGTAADCNNNGIPDACDLSGETSDDCNGDGTPDECQPPVAVNVIVLPASAGTATLSPANGPYALCTTLHLTAQAAPGYCFSHWTASAGAPPANAGSPQTTLAANQTMTVSAHFVPVIVQQPVSHEACVGDDTTLSVQAHALIAAGAGYQWRHNGASLQDGAEYSGTTTGTLLIHDVEAGSAGAYTCHVAHACGEAESAAALLSVGLPPAVAGGPPADLFVCPGNTISVSIAAGGSDVTLQWQFDGGGGFIDLSNGNGVTGATSSDLTIAGATASRSGLYRCRVSGPCGPDATSGACQVVVGTPPSVATPPPAELFVCPGQTLTLTASGAGTSPTYQWRFNNGGGWVSLSDGGDVSGATTGTLTIAHVNASRAGQYHCVIGGACPPSATTPACTLTVGADATIVTAPPASLSRCPGATAQISIGATGTALAYQWEFDAGDGSGFGPLANGPGVSGAGSPSLILTNVGEASEGMYRCTVAGSCGAPVATPAATLTVEPLTAIAGQPQSQEVCSGTPVGFSCEAAGAGLTYQWQFNGGAAFQNLANGNGVSGAQAATLILAAATTARAGLYRCVVLGQCGTPQISNAATLSVTTGVCDCNANGTPDEDDVATGFAADCNANGVPDECEVTSGAATDCDGNGVLDACELAGDDCNADGRLDRCEIPAGSGASGGPYYCTAHCDPDCNDNGVPDDCDIGAGESDDCNADGVPDECQPIYTADAGPDIFLCAGQVSAPLGGEVVAAPPHLNFSYQWFVVAGPAGPGAQGEFIMGTPARPLFRAMEPGEYVLRLSIAVQGAAACTASDDMTVTVYAMAVDAGADLTLCAGTESEPLSPAVSGGVGALGFQWSIEPGAPSMNGALFTGSGASSASPTFSPELPGTYVLRVSAWDSNLPACTVSDTLVVHATGMTASAPAGFSMGAGGTSAPLNVVVTSGGVQPFAYEWTIASGSPNTSTSQFGGGGPSSAGPTFTPQQAGQYALVCAITDSSQPPCTLVKTIFVNVTSMSVEAGADESICFGSGGVRLSPAANGGIPPIVHQWSIEPGAPSTDPVQFVEHGVDTGDWMFVPAAPGAYVLRYSATDGGTPPTVRSDTLLVRATVIDVDAGPDLTTQAFQPSARLGAFPLAVGGGALAYAWHVVAGPDLSSAQFEDAARDRPRFTPSAVGDYLLEVAVSDPASPGCVVTDRLVLTAIAAQQTLAVNVQGRLFMNLRLADVYAAAELRMAEAVPGRQVTGALFEDVAQGRTGLTAFPAIERQLSVTTEMSGGEFVAVVAMQYGESEATPGERGALRLHRWEPSLGLWRPAASGTMEDGTFPVRPTSRDLDRQGLDAARGVAWAIVNVAGDYAIGIHDPAALPMTGEPGLPLPDTGAGLCGAGATSASVMMLAAVLAPIRRRWRSGARSIDLLRGRALPGGALDAPGQRRESDGVARCSGEPAREDAGERVSY